MDIFDVVKRAARKTDSAIVAFSGGKDSLVALDIAAKHFKRVAVFFMYLVPGLEFEQATIRAAELRYGIGIVQLPHPAISYYFRHGVCCVRRDVPELTIYDVYAEIRDRTGLEWIVTGEKMQDSLQRRGMINKCKGIDEERHIFYPLALFTTRSVYAYMKLYGLHLPATYRRGTGSFGNLNSVDTLRIVREIYPEDWRRIRDVFPFVEAVVRRAEFGEAQSAKV